MGQLCKLAFVLGLGVLIVSCKETLPKPKAYLRLDYPVPQYQLQDNCDYTFEVNKMSTITEKKCDLVIAYPQMKATVYLSYKPIDNNLNTLLKDAQKLTYEHVVKADEIVEQVYQNADHKVYGMLYRLGGNAASNTQFYLTDSTKHFLVGSVYFYTKPNFDSIMPAAKYIEDDVTRIIESLKWKR